MAIEEKQKVTEKNNINITEKNDKNKDYSTMKSILFLLILLLGILLRIRNITLSSAGMQLAEAENMQNALSLYLFHSDTAGNAFPLYFISETFIQSPLYTYLLLPFVALSSGTVSVVVLRLLQVFFSVVTIWGAFFLLKEAANTTSGLWGMFLFSVSPWHLCISRLGIGNTLTHALLFFAILLFLKGLSKWGFLPTAGLLFALSVYSNPNIWPFVFACLLGFTLYGLLTKPLRSPKKILFFWGPCLVLLLPFLVNVPFRPLSFSVFFSNLSKWLSLAWTSESPYAFDSVEPFGFWGIATPYLIVLGAFILFSTLFMGIQKKKNTYLWLLLIPMLSCIPMCFFTELPAQEMSILFPFLILCGAIGANTVTSIFKSMHWPKVSTVILILFLLFETFQFFQAYDGSYQEEIAVEFISNISYSSK